MPYSCAVWQTVGSSILVKQVVPPKCATIGALYCPLSVTLPMNMTLDGTCQAYFFSTVFPNSQYHSKPKAQFKNKRNAQFFVICSKNLRTLFVFWATLFFCVEPKKTIYKLPKLFQYWLLTKREEIGSAKKGSFDFHIFYSRMRSRGADRLPKWVLW